MPRTVAALFIFVATVEGAHASIEPPKEKERWVSVRADEFLIFSNASDRETTTVATNLIRMRDALGQVTRLTVRSPLPTKSLSFETREVLVPIAKRFFIETL